MPDMQLFKRKRAEQAASDENVEATKATWQRADSTSSVGSMVEIPSGNQNGVPVDPIERFRIQYGNDAAYLRERDMYDPHPSVDHAWIAAGMVNQFGLYTPCMSYAEDRANAIAKYEKQKQREQEEEERQAVIIAARQKEIDRAIMTALGDPTSGIHRLPQYAHGMRLAMPEPRKSLVETGKDAGKVVGYHALAFARGYKAAQDIVAKAISTKVSGQRGRRMLKRAERRDHGKMMRDYLDEFEEGRVNIMLGLGAEEFDASGELVSGAVNDDKKWAEIDEEADHEANNDIVETADAAETSSIISFADLEGSYAVDNGRPMVKRGSMTRIFDMITRR